MSYRYTHTPLGGIEQVSLDPRQYRYWSPASQSHAAGDQLLRYLKAGWTPDSTVRIETRWFGEARHTLIYHLILRRGGQQLEMPVLASPLIRRMMRDRRLGLIPVETESFGEQETVDSPVID